MRRGYKERRRAHQMQELSLTPLIDTALTLLIIFMVATPMMQDAIKIALPKARGDGEREDTRKHDQIVYLDSKGALFLNGTQYSKETLIEQLRKQMAVQPDEVLFVKADQSIPYGSVIELVDQIKTVGGVQYVALATQKPTNT